MELTNFTSIERKAFFNSIQYKLTMSKILISYYSNTGSNEYLAHRFAKDLSAEIVEIKPRLKGHLWLMMLSFFKIPAAIKKLPVNLKDFNEVLLVGPIWTGQFIAPLRGFIKQYKKEISTLYFATCCGGGDNMKEDKFGYMHVFRNLEAMTTGISTTCKAFPIPLVLSEEEQKDDQLVMSTRLSDTNFKGEILKRYKDFLDTIKQS